MKDKLLSILLNPYLIAFFMALMVILLLPDYFSKYSIELLSQSIQNRIIHFEDLNNDMVNDKIIVWNNSAGNACFEFYDANQSLTDQYNFDVSFSKNDDDFAFYDINHNGFKELYFVGRRTDSLFLKIEEPFAPNGIKREIFIDIAGKFNGEYDYNSRNTFHFEDVNADNIEDVIFNVNARFSKSPRKIYLYDFKQDVLKKSDHLGGPGGILDIQDVNGDGKKELLCGGAAPCNVMDTITTRFSDCSTWIMVLDDNLNFIFEPIEFRAEFSSSNCIAVGNNILSYFKSLKTQKIPSQFVLLDNKGRQLKKVIIESFNSYWVFKNELKKEVTVFNQDNGQILVFDYNLTKKRTFQLDQEYKTDRLESVDLNFDGKKEWLNFYRDFSKVTVYNENFKPITNIQLDVPSYNNGSFRIGFNRTAGTFFIHHDNMFSEYRYVKNRWYYFEYLIYVGVFLTLLLLVKLIEKGQQIRLERKRTIEKEISELQIKSIKNQVDPHFVFNALNTISEMTLSDNKMETDNFICRFSDFMRQTLQSSDKITTTLKEELEYIENFIKLQKIRYSNNFDFSIEVGTSVDNNTLIPKHVLYTYVENAIKHGLPKTKGRGLIKIEVNNSSKGLLLAVEDNGTGITIEKSQKKNSTGNGLLVMEKIYKLYSKLNNKKIKHKLVERYDAYHEKCGLRVEILIA